MKPFEKEFIDFGINVFKDFGMDTLCARLISIMYLEPDEITMEELAEKTGYSLASISNKMKMLEGVGWVRKIKKPGSKKLYYIMEKDMMKAMMMKMELAIQKEVVPAKQVVPQIIERNRNLKLSEKEKKKMQIIKNYYQQMLKIEKMINHMKEYVAKM